MPASAEVADYVIAGNNYSGAILPNGTFFGWGTNAQGQASPQAGPFEFCAAGFQDTCCMPTTGNVQCWGTSDTTDDAPSTVLTSLSLGSGKGCGVTATGALLCWGNGFSEGGPPTDGNWTSVSITSSFGCALSAVNQSVTCWGANQDGQASPPLGSFNAVEVGNGNFACGHSTDGTASCWGSNTYGQAVAPAGVFESLSVGSVFVCGIRPGGALECWGQNANLELDSP